MNWYFVVRCHGSVVVETDCRKHSVFLKSLDMLVEMAANALALAAVEIVLSLPQVSGALLAIAVVAILVAFADAAQGLGACCKVATAGALQAWLDCVVWGD